MPYTQKQVKFFRAIEHGMKPTSGKGPSKGEAKRMLDEVGGDASLSPVQPSGKAARHATLKRLLKKKRH